MSFSVCIITNQVHAKLFEVLQSALPISDDVVLGTNGLSPADVDLLAAQFPQVRVLDLVWQGYGTTKNHLAAQANHHWILSLDSDEVLSDKLQKSIKELSLSDINTIYHLKRINFIGQQKVLHGDYAPELKPRLYHRLHAQWSADAVHETLLYPKNFKEISLEGALWHYTAKSIDEIRRKNDHYAQLSAQGMESKGKKTSFLKRQVAPLFAFVKNYFFKRGLLDGRIGWELANEQSRYTRQKYKCLKQSAMSKLPS